MALHCSMHTVDRYTRTSIRMSKDLPHSLILLLPFLASVVLCSTLLSFLLFSSPLFYSNVTLCCVKVVKALKHEIDVVRRKAVCALHR